MVHAVSHGAGTHAGRSKMYSVLVSTPKGRVQRRELKVLCCYYVVEAKGQGEHDGGWMQNCNNNKTTRTYSSMHLHNNTARDIILASIYTNDKTMCVDLLVDVVE